MSKMKAALKPWENWPPSPMAQPAAERPNGRKAARPVSALARRNQTFDFGRGWSGADRRLSAKACPRKGRTAAQLPSRDSRDALAPTCAELCLRVRRLL